MAFPQFRDMMMSRWSKLALAIAGLVLIIAGAIAAIDFRPDDRRVRLRPHQVYTHGAYLAYLSPWGADNAVTGFWGRRADNIRIDPARFPGKSRISWRWPPFGPPGEFSIWGYDHLAYGDYDGGLPEEVVEPRQVSQIRRFEQTFAWRGSFDYTQATLLTEFYLRSDPADADAKILEIGWFLHAPERTHEFVGGGKQMGDYHDPQGRVWQVAVNDKYLTFLRRDRQDTGSGSIDMLHALRWLQERGRISGDEWVTGVAIGVEPMKGFGHVEVERWQVRFD